MEAKSHGSGKGSVFTLWLPIAQPPEIGPTVPAAPVAASTDVLVVDDNRDSADSMTLLVDMLGHKASPAYDGPHAFALYDQVLPQVVLLDLSMPGMTSFDVIRYLRDRQSERGEAGGRRIIVAAMTGLGSDEDMASTRAAGFDAHLVKPVELAELGRVLAMAARKDT